MIDPHIARDPDIALMMRVRAGEPGAFEELVQRCRPRLLGFLQRFVDCRDDAEDLVQEVFLRVFRARRRYRAQSRFSTWLFAIAKNLARNSNRARRRQLVVDLNNAGAGAFGPGPLEELLSAETDPPGNAIERAELAAIVRLAVDGLKRRQRLVIQLHHFQGMSYDATARFMGLTPQAIKSLLWRARANLRETLQDYLRRSSEVKR